MAIAGCRVHQYALILALVLALHGIPEGLAVAVPMQAAGGGCRGVGGLFIRRAHGYRASLAYIGAILFLLAGHIPKLCRRAMLYIVCDELIPDAYESGDSHVAILGIGAGLILGLLLIAI